MARETVIHITDDIDGSKGAEEVSFAYQGTEYRIDLGKKRSVPWSGGVLRSGEAA